MSIVGCVRVQPSELLAGPLARLLDLLGGWDRFIKPGDRVFLKPNLVAPFPAAVTDFQFIAAVVAAVKACGGRPVLGESAGFEFDTDKTLRALGAFEWAETLQVPLLNLDAGAFEHLPAPAPFGSLRVARAVLEADVLINLPKLKRHSLTVMTGALKNLFGVLHRDTRRRLHAWDLHRGIVVLNGVLRPHLTLMEGLVTLSRAVYGQAHPLGVLLGGVDSLALDRLGCCLLGLDEAQVAHVRRAITDPAAPAYQVAGDALPLPLAGPHAQTVGSRLHHALIQAAYIVDIPYAAVSGKSLLPRLHFELGVKPSLNAGRCTGCGACARTCPVDAVDVPARRIITQRCQCLRCLKCVSVCPKGAIEVKGWRRPRS